MDNQPFNPHADLKAPRATSTRGLSVDQLYAAIADRGGSPILIVPALGGGVLFTTADAQPAVTATVLECLARQLRRQARKERKRKDGN